MYLRAPVLVPGCFLFIQRTLWHDVNSKHLPSVHDYTDGAQLYFAFRRPNNHATQDSAVAEMEVCIRNIRRWKIESKLNLNEDKSEFTLIWTKVQLRIVNIPGVGTPIHNWAMRRRPTAHKQGIKFKDFRIFFYKQGLQITNFDEFFIINRVRVSRTGRHKPPPQPKLKSSTPRSTWMAWLLGTQRWSLVHKL